MRKLTLEGGEIRSEIESLDKELSKEFFFEFEMDGENKCAFTMRSKGKSLKGSISGGKAGYTAEYELKKQDGSEENVTESGLDFNALLKLLSNDCK